jgi:hypothetical protein
MSIQAYDPPVINTFHQADPAAHVWSCEPDKVYIYGSHDWNTSVPDDNVGGTVRVLLDPEMHCKIMH